MNREFASWEANAFISKAYRDDKGKMHVVAIASDDNVDLQRDVMALSALQKMAEQAKKGVPLFSTHKDTFEFGRSVFGDVVRKTDGGRVIHQLVVDLELNGDYPQARQLFKEVVSGKCDKQVSIGGKLNLKNHSAVNIEMTEKGLVRKIMDLDLDHIACTRHKQAANPRTGFVEAVMKSLEQENAFEHFPVVDLTKTKEAGSLIAKDPLASVSNEKVNIEENNTTKDIQTGLDVLAKIGSFFRNVGGNYMNTKKEKPLEPALLAAGEEKKEKKQEPWPMEEVVAEEEPEVPVDDNGKKQAAKKQKEVEEEENAEEEVSVVVPVEDEAASGDKVGNDTVKSKKKITKEDLAAVPVGTVVSEEELEETEELETVPVAPAEELGVFEDDLVEPTELEEEAAKTLLAARKTRLEKIAAKKKLGLKEASDSTGDIVREIAILLSKADIDEEDEIEDEIEEIDENLEAKAIKAAAHNIRYLLAKRVLSNKEKGPIAILAKEIVNGGPYAPTDLSGAKSGEANDKAKGDADIAARSVTAHSKIPTYAEVAAEVEAPSNSTIANQMSNTIANIGKLPQSADTAEFGKSLNAVVEKTISASGEMVMKAIEKVLEVQKSQNEVLSKRLERLEKASGVSHSGPRGTGDSEILKSRTARNNVFGGLFLPAAKQATKGM